MRAFSPSVAVVFLGLAAVLKSWPLGLCAVAVIGLMTAKEVCEAYFNSKRESALEVQLREAIEEHKKLKEEMGKVSSAMGAMNYKVNELSHYIGKPE